MLNVELTRGVELLHIVGIEWLNGSGSFVCIYFLLVDISITNCLLVTGMELIAFGVVTIWFV